MDFENPNSYTHYIPAGGSLFLPLISITIIEKSAYLLYQNLDDNIAKLKDNNEQILDYKKMVEKNEKRMEKKREESKAKNKIIKSLLEVNKTSLENFLKIQNVERISPEEILEIANKTAEALNDINDIRDKSLKDLIPASQEIIEKLDKGNLTIAITSNNEAKNKETDKNNQRCFSCGCGEMKHLKCGDAACVDCLME